MALQRVDIHHDSSRSVPDLFAYLAHHENLSALFGIKVERVRDGDTEPDGVGSVRRLSVAGRLPFEETTTEYVLNEKIAYKITKGSPLKGHHGLMTFSPNGSGSHLHYVIEFDAAVPGLAPVVRAGLDFSIRRGLKKQLP